MSTADSGQAAGALAAAAQRLEALLQPRGWEQPATVWALYRHLPTGPIRAQRVRLAGGPLERAADGRPMHALLFRARLGEVTSPHPGEIGWAVSAEGLHRGVRAALDASGGVAVQQPAGPAEVVEVRIVTAVLKDGTDYVLMRRRDNDQITQGPWTPEHAIAGLATERALRLLNGLPEVPEVPADPPGGP